MQRKKPVGGPCATLTAFHTDRTVKRRHEGQQGCTALCGAYPQVPSFYLPYDDNDRDVSCSQPVLLVEDRVCIREHDHSETMGLLIDFSCKAPESEQTLYYRRVVTGT